MHPTQIYEVLIMGCAAFWLWRRRSSAAPVGPCSAGILVLAGLERFGIEILRAKDDRFLGVFTLAQLTSVGLVVAGTLVLRSWRSTPNVAPGPYLGGTAQKATQPLSTAASA